METQLFDWDGWDGDQESQVFYNVVLKADIGPYRAGRMLAMACVAWCDSTLELWERVDDEKASYKCKLVLSVGEEIEVASPTVGEEG